MIGTVADVTKHRTERDVKKGFATVMPQCNEGVRSKLEVPGGWDEIWSKQKLHKLSTAV